jgi:hypothetical protein
MSIVTVFASVIVAVTSPALVMIEKLSSSIQPRCRK